jgi:hypothetical protein
MQIEKDSKNNRVLSDEERLKILANFIIDKFLEKRGELGLKPVIKADNMDISNDKN